MLRFTGRPLRKNFVFLQSWYSSQCFDMCYLSAFEIDTGHVFLSELWSHLTDGRAWLCSRLRSEFWLWCLKLSHCPPITMTLLKSHVKYQETSAETNLLLPGEWRLEAISWDLYHTHVIIYKTENKDLLHSRGSLPNTL